MGGAIIRRVFSSNSYYSGRNCGVFVGPVFWPGSCYGVAQVVAGPGIKTGSPGEGRRTGRGWSVSKHVGDDRSPNAGLAVLAKLSSALHLSRGHDQKDASMFCRRSMASELAVSKPAPPSRKSSDPFSL